jgi:ABC-type multidrug transport system fused ATPase/permease subunit
MIPSVKSKTVPPPPEATYDLAKVVQEPTSILKLYRGRFSRPLFLGFLLNLGSLSFNIVLPYEIGQFISIINTLEYSSKINSIA